MRRKMLKTSLATILLSSIIVVNAAEVFTWRDSKGNNEYSDAPKHLIPANAQKFNVRTHATTSLAPPRQTAAVSASDVDSLAAQQALVNRRIEEQNRQTAEQNKKIQEQNRKNREEACKTSQINRKIAENMRTNQRETLIKRYDEEIRNNCN
ncbi:MAG: DUF4124 domain-containing protein [Snodgrassella sp.]|nr:DUF4124 domain-containing protein [Snodgrassella sp.]